MTNETSISPAASHYNRYGVSYDDLVDVVLQLRPEKLTSTALRRH